MAPPSSPDRIVVGIDFGTTFSGVAFAYSGNAEAADDIAPIKSWPGANGINSDKVPSELVYEPLQVVRWGFQLRPEEVRLRCMKLFLDPRQDMPTYISKAEMEHQLNRFDKTAETAVTDYLIQLFKHAHETLVKRFGKFFVSSTKIEVILTVPAVWSDTAQSATLRAAKAAGAAVGSGMTESLTLISEPEAAAVYTLKAIQSQSFKEGDNVIVLDAGGGTVDLISYEIDQLSPLRIQESAEGNGKCCGAAFLNLAFEQYLSSKLGSATFKKMCRQAPRGWEQAQKEFEQYVKRNYNPEGEPKYFIPFNGAPDMPEAGLEGGYFEMPATAVGELFKPIVADVIVLVSQQIDAVKAKGKQVAGILLVGGFGQSDHLHKMLQKRFEDDSSLPPAYSVNASSNNPSRPGLQVVQPSNAWTAVVRAAVLRGLEGAEIVLSRKSRNHYGTICSSIYNPSIHPPSAKYRDALDGHWRAKETMSWFIAKGQTVSSSAPVLITFSKHFTHGQTRSDRAELIVCSADAAPVMYKPGPKFRTLCTLQVDLKPVPARQFHKKRSNSGQIYHQLDFELGMQIKSGTIKFDLRVEDKVYGDITAKFE